MHEARLLRFVAFVAWLGAAACSDSYLDAHKQATIREPLDLLMPSLTVIHVDPAGKEVAADWKRYRRRGDGMPSGTLTLTAGEEIYTVSDIDLRSHEIRVNGEVHTFDPRAPEFAVQGDSWPSECVAITFGRGFSFGPGKDPGLVRDPLEALPSK